MLPACIDEDLILLAFGVSSLAGIWGVGPLVDRMLRALVLLAIGSFAAVGIQLTIAGDHGIAV